jgi:group I intron endonuclease
MPAMIIYQIKNIVNGDIYIGKTTQEFHKRISSHKKLARDNKGFYIHRAMRKYGIENFYFTILIRNINDENLLNTLEILLIENLKPKYNLTSGGEGTKGLLRTKEHCSKISKALTGRKLTSAHCKKISERKLQMWQESKDKILKSRLPVSQETKDKISKSRKGQVSNRKGIKLSEETRKKMSDSHKNRNQLILVT